MRVIFDTNVVISGILWRGPAKQVLDLWLQGDLTLLISLPILEEYREVLSRFINPKTELFAKWDHHFADLSELIHPLPIKTICRDPDDQKFLEAAVGGKANVLISGDLDLRTLKEIHGISIQSPRMFLRR